MTLRRTQISIRALLACTFLVATTCAALVALNFDLYYSPFVILPSFLAIALLITRSAVLVSSVGCVLSLLLVVVGHEHVRGPIGILCWFSYRAGLTQLVVEMIAPFTLSAGAMLSSVAMRNSRRRFWGSLFAALGMLGVWCYWTWNSMFLGWEYLSSVPFFVCLGWRVTLDASNSRTDREGEAPPEP